MDSFFVLSGFLIGGILYDAKGSANYFKTFYFRRFHRILPVYAILLACFYVGYFAVAPTGPGYLHRLFNAVLPLWSYPLFVQNVFAAFREHWGAEWLSATWSLAVEEQFYLLLPLTIYLFSRRTVAWLTVLAVVGAPLVRFALVHAGNTEYGPYTLLPGRADGLGIGVLLAFACRQQVIWEWFVSNRKKIRAACVALLAGYVIFAHWQQPEFTSVYAYTYFSLYFATLILLLLITPGKALKALFTNRIVLAAGTYSYTVYLFHYPLFGLCHYIFFRAPPSVHDVPTLMVTCLALVLSIGFAMLSWRVLERPLIRRAHARYRYGRVEPEVMPRPGLIPS